MPVAANPGPDDDVILTFASQDEVARLKAEFGNFNNSVIYGELNGEEIYFPIHEYTDECVSWENEGGSFRLEFATGRISYHSPDYEEAEWSIKFIRIEEE